MSRPDINEPARTESPNPSPTPALTVDSNVATQASQTAVPARGLQGPIRIYWRAEMTIAFLEFCRELRNENKLDSPKNVYLKAPMEEIIPKLRQRWPRVPWTVKKLTDHYKNLRRKHQRFLWMMNKTGTSYDKETGMIHASDEQWLAYEREHSKEDIWLRSIGLPRADLYDAVFAGNTASGVTVI